MHAHPDRHRGVAFSGLVASLALVTALSGAAHADPSIDTVTQTGTRLVIAGGGFGESAGESAVRIDALEMAVESWSDDEIVAAVPLSLRAGFHTITADVVPGAPATAAVALRPVVIALSTSAAQSGDELTIDGAFFGRHPTGSDAVFIGDGGAPITVSDARWTPGAITIVVPERRAATLPVAVRTHTLVSAEAPTLVLRPTVAAVEPMAAGVGDVVVVRGTGFGEVASPTDLIELGDVRTGEFLDWSPTAITLRVPPGACDGLTLLLADAVGVDGPFTRRPVDAIDATDLVVSGGRDDGVARRFGEGTALVISLEAGADLEVTATLDPVAGGSPIDVPMIEVFPGRYVGAVPVAGEAPGYPGDGAYVLDVAAGIDCGAAGAARTFDREIRFRTGGPVIDLVRRDNNPPPGQDDRYLPGDTVAILMRGDPGTSEFALRNQSVTIPLGTGTPVGPDYVKEFTIFGGFSGEWLIQGSITDAFGNTTTLDSPDVVLIANDELPRIDRQILDTPPHEATDAIGAGESVTFRLGSFTTTGVGARVLLIDAEGEVAAEVGLSAASPDGGAGEAEAWEETVAASTLPEGRFSLDYQLCSSGSVPGQCEIGSGCNCRRLVDPTSLSDRVLRVDRTAPDVTVALSPVASGARVAGSDCDPIAVRPGDGVLVRVTPDDVTEAITVSVAIPSLGLASAEMARDADGSFALTVVVPALAADGDHDVEALASDGVNTVAASATVHVDGSPPDAPSVTVITSTGTSDVSVGDAITIIATSEETDLSARLTLSDRLVGAPMVAVTPTRFELVWEVPEDDPGRAESLVASVTLQDCVNASSPGTGAPVSLDTVELVIDAVSVGGDCLSLDAPFRIQVLGSPGAALALATLETTFGVAVVGPLTLAEVASAYETTHDFTTDERDALVALDPEGTTQFVVVATLARNERLSSPTVPSPPFVIRDGSPGPVEITGVGTDGRPIGDDVVVPARTFELHGTRSASDAIWARVPGQSAVEIAPITGSSSWTAPIDLDAFGLGGEPPYTLEIFARNCAVDGVPRTLRITIDAVAPTVSAVTLTQGGTGSGPFDPARPIDVSTVVDDDRSALIVELVYRIGDPVAGGIGDETRVPLVPDGTARGGTTYRGQIPPDALGPAGVRAAVEATDGANTTVSDPIAPALAVDAWSTDTPGSVYALDDAGAGGVAPYTWHLISVPGVLDVTDVADVMEAIGLGGPDPTRWRVLRWDATGPTSGAYVEATSSRALALEPGTSYWLHWRESATHPGHVFDFGPGRTSGLEPVTLSLEPGWNQIATPFAIPTAWPDGAPVLRAYAPARGDYLDAGEGGALLRPFAGYFVEAPAAMNVVLDPSVTPDTDPSPAHPAGFAGVGGAWALRLVFQSPRTQTAVSYVGVHPDAADGDDRFDLGRRPPRPGDRVRLDLAGTDAPLEGDIRPPRPEEITSWAVDIHSERTVPDARLTWDIIGEIPTGMTVVAVDSRSGARVDVRSDALPPLGLIAGERHRVRIVAGPRDLVSEAVPSDPVPTALVARAPHPNPFRGGVRIGYGLPTEEDVMIDILDVGGRRVYAWSLGRQGAGSHAVVWDGRGEDGRGVPPGVYFVDIRAGGSRARAKIVRTHGKGGFE